MRLLRILSTAAGVCVFLSQAAFPQAQDTLIAGRVLDSSSSPLFSRIRLYQLSIEDGQVTRTPSCTTETDQAGRFRCGHLEAGVYIVQALLLPKTYKTDTDKSRIDPVTVYYPGVTDLERAEPVRVKPALENWFDIRVSVPKLHSISAPLRGIPATADLRLEAIGNKVQIDTAIEPRRALDKGVFSFSKVPDGHYRLSAVWRTGVVPHRLEAFVAVSGNDVELVKMGLVQPVKLQGSISGDHADQIRMVLLYREDNTLPKWIGTLDHGSFTFAAVPPGKYYFALPVHGSELVSSVSVDGRVTQGAGLEIAEGETHKEVQLAIAPTTTQIVGTVPDTLQSKERVRVVARSSDTGHVSTVVTDDHGRFSITGLAPGSYSVFAWPESEDPPYRTQEVLNKLEKFSVSASVQPSGRTDLGELQMIHPSPL